MIDEEELPIENAQNVIEAEIESLTSAQLEFLLATLIVHSTLHRGIHGKKAKKEMKAKFKMARGLSDETVLSLREMITKEQVKRHRKFEKDEARIVLPEQFDMRKH